MKIMVTGHRPARLRDHEKAVRKWLNKRLKEFCPEFAISGMAQGVDQIFAEEANKLGIKVSAVLPYPKKWENLHPHEQELLTATFEVVYCSEGYSKKAYYKRDCAMVDAADIILAVWDGKKEGGTWLTIEYALKQGKEVIFYPGRDMKGVISFYN